MDTGWREFRFRGDLYSQESTFPLVISCKLLHCFDMLWMYCGFVVQQVVWPDGVNFSGRWIRDWKIAGLISFPGRSAFKKRPWASCSHTHMRLCSSVFGKTWATTQKRNWSRFWILKNNVKRRKRMFFYRPLNISAWVSEQFLHGTSAHYKLFSHAKLVNHWNKN